MPVGRSVSATPSRRANLAQIRRLFRADTASEPEDPEFQELRCMHFKLHALHEPTAHLPGTCVTNDMLAYIVETCLQWLLGKAPLGRLPPWYWIDREVISKGNAYPQTSSNRPVDESYNTWLAILDVLDHEPYSRLLASICNILAKRRWLELTLAAANPDRPRSELDTANMEVCFRLLGDAIVEKAVAFTIWLKKLFAQQWNAQPIVQRRSTCGGILELMKVIHTTTKLAERRSEVFFMEFITSHVSVLEIAQAWVADATLRQDTNGSKEWCYVTGGVHLLRYRFLFSTTQLNVIFRTINHLTMRYVNPSTSIFRRGEKHKTDVYPVKHTLWLHSLERSASNSQEAVMRISTSSNDSPKPTAYSSA